MTISLTVTKIYGALFFDEDVTPTAIFNAFLAYPPSSVLTHIITYSCHS
jgi:hypothetical protein